jgi:hypothetical protein
MDTDRADYFEPFQMTIPVKLLPEEVEAFVEFVFHYLKGLENHPSKNTSSIKRFETEDGLRLDFVYKAPGSTTGNFYTKNSLSIERGDEEGVVSVKLKSYGDQEWAHTTGSLIRMIAMRYSTR